VLVPLYRVALRVGDALRGEPKRLQWPVVSVGSLSAGGAGKTPVVIALAKMLHERGWGVDVLSRGYGRSGRGVEMVAAPREKQILRYAQDDNSLDGMAERFGDEPVLIAERAGVDVWVGADRFEAGKEAEGLTQSSQSLTQGFAEEKHVPHSTDAQGNDNNKNKGQLHLLDDGFQHRQLGRAMDVVLVTADDLEDTLLPAGNLREPLSALQRADVVVVREDEFEAVGKRVWAMVREGAQMWTVRRTLRFPAPMFVFGAGLKPVAFCAIARPEGFATMLMEAGCGIVETVAFVDHHRYTIADVQRVIEVAKGLNATGFVTTEKDAVKLSAAMRERLEAVGPLMVVALEAEFADAEKVVATVERFARAEEKQIPHSTDAQGNDNKKSKSNGKNEKQILRSAQDDSRKWDDNPKNTGGAR
jgi:tetraacyldisaccharide 4'-kinase